jgi:hypothetical protein
VPAARVQVDPDQPVVESDAESRDPLDIPFVESGVTPPTYYNPIQPGLRFYIHAWQGGRSVLLWKGVVKDGTYRYATPRQEQWVRANIRKHLGGNDPERWRGDNLEEDDRWFCADCQFTTRNTKVAQDHRRAFEHQERPPK